MEVGRLRTQHAAPVSAADRPGRTLDRLGPLEIAIGLLVLATALSLVLVSRSVASRTTITARPPAVRVSAPPGPVERPLAPDDSRAERTTGGDVV